MSNLDLKGIHCVLYAFFTETGALDRSAMARQTSAVLAAGVDGITVLGLATEVLKLSAEERRSVIDWAMEDVAAKVPVSVTISGNSIAEQVKLAAYATDAGADWLILQPPMVGNYPADEYVAFFEAVGATITLPWAVQNAPAYLGRSLSAGDLTRLKQGTSNFAAIKAESCANDVKPLIDTLGLNTTILNGRGGIEMIDNLRAGCHGFVLAPDAIDHAAACWQQWQDGDFAGAEQRYAAALPAITFIMQSLESLICYGKRVFGQRVDIPVFDRAPATRPSEFGLQSVEKYVADLGQWPQNK